MHCFLLIVFCAHFCRCTLYAWHAWRRAWRGGAGARAEAGSAAAGLGEVAALHSSQQRGVLRRGGVCGARVEMGGVGVSGLVGEAAA